MKVINHLEMETAALVSPVTALEFLQDAFLLTGRKHYRCIMLYINAVQKRNIIGFPIYSYVHYDYYVYFFRLNYECISRNCANAF